MSNGQLLPESVFQDERTSDRFKVALADGLAEVMDESDWKRLALLHGLTDQIVKHPRFLRSLKWDDDDYEGHVLDLVSFLFEDGQDALIYLVELPSIQIWFRENVPDLLDLWNAGSDPLIDAVAQGLDEIDAVSGVVDLNEHASRIKRALPGDPYQAIGATKDMVEAAMRTILFQRGVADIEGLDFPALTSRCFAELNLSASSAPNTEEERLRRKIASSAKNILIAANELRNRTGAGHGRVIGTEQGVSSADVSLVASTGLILAAWLLRNAESE